MTHPSKASPLDVKSRMGKVPTDLAVLHRQLREAEQKLFEECDKAAQRSPNFIRVTQLIRELTRAIAALKEDG